MTTIAEYIIIQIDSKYSDILEEINKLHIEFNRLKQKEENYRKKLNCKYI